MILENKTDRSLRLMPRDLQMLCLMHRYSFLTMEDVRDELWDGKDNKNHSARLRQLERAALIERLEVFAPGEIAYRLTTKGCRVLKDLGLVPAEQEYRCRSYSTQFRHDKNLNRILRMFQKQNFVSYIETERDLRSRYRQKIQAFKNGQDEFKIPDGRIVIRTPTGTQINVALELELTFKSRSAYKKVFTDYQRLNDWQVLLYVLKDRESVERMAGIVEELYLQRGPATALFHESPVYLTTLDQALVAPEQGTWIVRGKALELKEIIQIWPISNPYRATGESALFTPPPLRRSEEETKK